MIRNGLVCVLVAMSSVIWLCSTSETTTTRVSSSSSRRQVLIQTNRPVSNNSSSNETWTMTAARLVKPTHHDDEEEEDEETMMEEDEESMSSTLQRRVCYFANWAPYRELSPPLYPDDIDPTLCTHIHYAFAKIDVQTLALLPTEEHDMNWTERTNMPLYIRLYGLKRRNMALKILLAVGGWSAKSDGFNLASRNHHNRSRFINQTIKVLREWNFDGVDLGWTQQNNMTNNNKRIPN